MPPSLNADREAPSDAEANTASRSSRPWERYTSLLESGRLIPGLDSGWNAEQGLDEIL